MDNNDKIMKKFVTLELLIWAGCEMKKKAREVGEFALGVKAEDLILVLIYLMALTASHYRFFQFAR